MLSESQRTRRKNNVQNEFEELVGKRFPNLAEDMDMWDLPSHRAASPKEMFTKTSIRPWVLDTKTNPKAIRENDTPLTGEPGCRWQTIIFLNQTLWRIGESWKILSAKRKGSSSQFYILWKCFSGIKISLDEENFRDQLCHVPSEGGTGSEGNLA